jgi:acetoin utilization deacetylase AcuC-like enzyme
METASLSHTEKYLKFIENCYEITTKEKPKQVGWVNGDVYVNNESLISTKTAAQGCKHLVDHIMKGKWCAGFGLLRPPGHHAHCSGLSDAPSGFCFINNVCMGAVYA